MTRKFISLAILLLLVIVSCNSKHDTSPGSDDQIQREEELPKDIFERNGKPGKLIPRGSNN